MAHAANADHGHHITPPRTLLTVLAVLAGLTALTVWTGKADWIPSVLHVPLALVIATIKVVFVVRIFMGLKYDNRVNSLAFVSSLVFVGVFLTFTLFDTMFRGDLGNVDSQTIRDEQALVAGDSLLLARYGTLLVTPTDSANARNAVPADTAGMVTGLTAPGADTTRDASTTLPAASLDTTSAAAGR